jgi:hypothetical protein
MKKEEEDKYNIYLMVYLLTNYRRCCTRVACIHPFVQIKQKEKKKNELYSSFSLSLKIEISH